MSWHATYTIDAKSSACQQRRRQEKIQQDTILATVEGRQGIQVDGRPDAIGGTCCRRGHSSQSKSRENEQSLPPDERESSDEALAPRGRTGIILNSTRHPRTHHFCRCYMDVVGLRAEKILRDQKSASPWGHAGLSLRIRIVRSSRGEGEGEGEGERGERGSQRSFQSFSCGKIARRIGESRAKRLADRFPIADWCVAI